MVLHMHVGLTEQEISMAEGMVPQQPSAGPLTRAPPLPPRALTPALPPSNPRTWSDYAVMAAVFGGVSYAIFHFVKVSLKYEPWNCVILQYEPDISSSRITSFLG